MTDADNDLAPGCGASWTDPIQGYTPKRGRPRDAGIVHRCRWHDGDSCRCVCGARQPTPAALRTDRGRP